MSASYFRTLFAYNRWAWTKVLDQVAALDEAEYTDPRFNFGSVRSTLTHISGIEATYLARLLGQPPLPRRTQEDFPTFAALRERWQRQLDEEFSYIGANGQPASSRRDLFLAQFFNHSTQHRSEAAVAITEFGHSPGDLDVFIFVRENGPVP